MISRRCSFSWKPFIVMSSLRPHFISSVSHYRRKKKQKNYSILLLGNNREDEGVNEYFPTQVFSRDTYRGEKCKWPKEKKEWLRQFFFQTILTFSLKENRKFPPPFHSKIKRKEKKNHWKKIFLGECLKKGPQRCGVISGLSIPFH